VHLLAQSVWYAVFGFGNVQMRLLSGFFAVLGLISLYYWVVRLTGDRLAAAIATVLMAQDGVFLFHSAVGRMDAMCLGFGMIAQAAYVGLRERNLSMALLVSSVFTTLAGLTHPNAIIFLATLLVTILVLDVRRLRVQHILPFALPFVIGGIGYGLWAMQDMVGFRAQIIGNRAGERMTLLHPLDAIAEEILRYKVVFYGSEYNPGPFAKLKLFLLLIWAGGYFGRIFVCGLKDRVSILLALCGAIPVVVLTFFNAKNMYYLIYIVPFLAANAGVLFSVLWNKGVWMRRIAVAAVAVTLAISGSVTVKRLVAFRANHVEYRNLMSETQKLMPDQGRIIAPASYAFALGFDRVVQDDNLGYYSHRCPALIIDAGLAPDETERLGKDAPEVLKHRNQMLQVNYQTVGTFLYKRLSCPSGTRPE
jgi:4-amino-4-deoxy-L-arabinose transferase-like glycosyltransferase